MTIKINVRWVAIAAAVIAVLFLATYVASPYMAAHALQTAAKKGDRDKLEQLVDFPAVRDSLKSQLMTALSASMKDDPEMRDNPFAALGMLMVPAIVNNAIDLYVTPDGIAAMTQGRKPGEEGASEPVAAPAEGAKVKTSMGYSDLDTFRARFSAEGQQPLTMVMRRRGLFEWRLKRIELPTDFMDNTSTESDVP